MEEAERLCDRVAIIDHGRIVDIGSPAELVDRHCPERAVVFSPTQPVDADSFASIPGFLSIDDADGALTLSGKGEGFVSAVIDHLARHSIRVTRLRTIDPNLEDVFLRLTGHSLRD